MMKILSALEELNQMYRELRKSAFEDCSVDDAENTTAVAEAILRRRSMLSTVEKAQGRLSALMAQWRDEPGNPDDRRRCRELAADAQQQVMQLIGICAKRTRLLESGIAALRENLRQIENGARYLQSARPAATPPPKFIDSLG